MDRQEGALITVIPVGGRRQELPFFSCLGAISSRGYKNGPQQ